MGNATKASVPQTATAVGQAEARLPTAYGTFRIRTYPTGGDAPPPLALVRGDGHGSWLPLVRVHSQCLTGDAFASLRCDCGPQLEAALRLIGRARDGALVYLRQEGRGIGLDAKVRAYALQDRGLDTYDANVALGLPADARTYEAAARILEDLGMTSIRLLTNNPEKVRALEALGIRVVQTLPLVAGIRPQNRRYLATKRDRFGHRLPAWIG